MVGNRRLTRRELKQKDQVLTGMEAMLHWVEHHSRQALVFVIALMLLIAAGIAGASWWHAQANAANGALGEAVEIYQGSVGEAAETGATAQSAKSHHYATAAAKYQASADKAAAVAKLSGANGVGRAAALLEAGSLARLGKTEDAVKAYRVLAQDNPRDPFAAGASLALADLLAAKGSTDEAIERYRKLAAAESVYVPKEAVLDHLARTLEKKGDTDGARDAYQRLADEAGDSPDGTRAKAKLGELKAAAKPGPEATPIKSP